MFIRQTKTRSTSDGGSYFTHRLVESKRIGAKVRQRTVLNLGTNFDLPKDLWPELCIRIEQILNSEPPIIATDPSIEKSAQHLYSQIIARRGGIKQLNDNDGTGDTGNFEEVDLNSIQQIKPRTVGPEHVSLEALKDLQIPQILEEAGFSGRQQAEALGNIIGRMCAPRSERATAKWLKEKSALGELLKYDFAEMPLMQLYRASDRLLRSKYKLRTTLIDWDDETLWRTYTMLTDLEAVFRSLKSELGMRPVYHHKEDRCDGHLFITVLAYQAVQVIRRKLKDHGINESWATLREKLKQQCRITATFKQRDGKTLHIRQASRPEEELGDIYKKLGLSPDPGGLQRVRI
jgi:hypothetical protein